MTRTETRWSMSFPVPVACTSALRAGGGRCRAGATAASMRRRPPGRDLRGALWLKSAAVVSILAAGDAGVLVPVLGSSSAVPRPDDEDFFVAKAFAADVIRDTGALENE